MGWQIFEVPKSMQGPVLNADDMENKHGIVRHECKLLIQINGHVEWMRFILLNIGETKMILGHNWLLRHNPEINWVAREITMTRCPDACKEWQGHIRQCVSVKKVQDPIAEMREKLPEEIKDYADVFVERPIGQLPTRKPWDHCVDLREGFIR